MCCFTPKQYFENRAAAKCRRFFKLLTFSAGTDIIITENVIVKGARNGRENAKGGALTEGTFFILLSLYTPRHGYAVMQFIEEKTAGRLALGAGTLYGALTSLQAKGWIAPCGRGEARKKEYQITAAGREVTKRELLRLQELAKTASEIMEG